MTEPLPKGRAGATGDETARAEALLALYGEVRAATAALREAAERGQLDGLDETIAAREARLAEAQGLIAGHPGAASLPPTLRARVAAALRDLQAEDDALRALLSSLSQELPGQLAAVRDARRAAAGYEPAPQRARYVDRRG